MKHLDWRQLLTEHGIPYVESGANVKRGELNIRCPFCGSADPSYHMGLNQETGFWACWRNDNHRGKSPVRLIAKLLDLPYWKARRVAGIKDQDAVDPDGFDAVAARLLGRTAPDAPQLARRDFLPIPREFKDLHDAPPRFYDYIRHTRGFGSVGTRDAIDWYGLSYAVKGAYKDRVILPYYVDGKIVAWTGRAIGPATIRYRDLEVDDCLVPIKHTLYNLDCRQQGGRVLVVVEGPIDALKLDVFGREYGVRAAGLSTNSIQDEQIYLLEEMSAEFDLLLFMMDMSTDLGVVDSMRMRDKVRTIRNAKTWPVPFGCKDAAELTPRQVAQWAKEITR